MPQDLISTDDLARLVPGLEYADQIARGGFKLVYKAQIKSRVEALKLIQLPTQEGPNGDAFFKELMARVKREIELLSKCSGMQIVKLGSVTPSEVEIQGCKYIIYSEEFLSGKNLAEEINLRSQEGQAQPSFNELKVLTLSLLRAIEETWKHGAVHRDIKPLNVMKTTDPKRPFVLLDFGIAFSLVDTRLTTMPDHRAPMGTWRYMAPEMLRLNFRDNMSFRSDLYTIALTVFEYAVGVHPLALTGDDVLATISRIRTQEPARLVDKRPDLPPEFSKTIDQMMKKTPALRPGNIDALIRKLEAIQ